MINFKQYKFSWVWPDRVWFTIAVMAKSEVFKEDFVNIFHFALPFFQALFKRWTNNKLKVILVTFTSYYIVLYYTQFNKTVWDHGGNNSLETPWISNAKTEWWLMPSGKSRVLENMHVFVTCKIDVLNKQLVSPLSWNNPLSETSLDEWYILMSYRHLQGKEKHHLDAKGVFNI